MYWAVCTGEPQSGRGNFFLGPDTEYKGNPSYRRVWGNLGRAGGTFFWGWIRNMKENVNRAGGTWPGPGDFFSRIIGSNRNEG